MTPRFQVFASSSSWALAFQWKYESNQILKAVKTSHCLYATQSFLIVLFPCRSLAAHPLSGAETTYAYAYAMASGRSVQLVILCGHVPVFWGNYKITFVLKAMVTTWTAFELSLNGWRGHYSTLSLPCVEQSTCTGILKFIIVALKLIKAPVLMT